MAGVCLRVYRQSRCARVRLLHTHWQRGLKDARPVRGRARKAARYGERRDGTALLPSWTRQMGSLPMRATLKNVRSPGRGTGLGRGWAYRQADGDRLHQPNAGACARPAPVNVARRRAGVHAPRRGSYQRASVPPLACPSLVYRLSIPYRLVGSSGCRMNVRIDCTPTPKRNRKHRAPFRYDVHGTQRVFLFF